MKKVVITGASGFVGTSLKNMFMQKNFEVRAIKRDELRDNKKLINIIEESDIVINLAGANIINRWTDSYKKLLYTSRLDTTKAIIEAIKNAKSKPELLISTSAVGVYANKKCYDEQNYEYTEDFLGKLCQDWEKEAFRAKEFGVRTAVFRFGIVLGKGGGALEKMITPFKFGLGGTIGNGNQHFSYIHLKDLLNAYDFVYKNSSCEGVYNLTAPTPTTNKGLTKALGEFLNRPTILPVPEFMLNLIFSEGAKVLTDGQCVKPKRLLDAGFEFEYKTIKDTISDLV